MKNLIILLLFPLFSQAQTRPILFYDDCEGNKLSSFVGGRCELSNAYVSNGWTGYQGYNTAGSITKSSAYARKGTYSYQFKLNGGRPTGNWQDQKAELSWNFYPAGTPSGLNGCSNAFNKPLLNIRWMAGSSYIPVESNLPSDPNLRISFLFNTKSAPDAPATSSFVEICNGRYRIANTVPASGGYKITLYDAGPVVKGVWVDWVLERNYSTGNDGYVRWYKNGVLVNLGGSTTLTGPNWFPNISKEPYVQNGLYRFAAMPNDFILYLDEFKFGDVNATLEDMLPAGDVVPNQPPTVTINPSVVSTNTTTATVIATSTDPDGFIADRSWTFMSGPATPSLTGTLIDTLKASNLTADGEYVFRLIATDNLGLKDTGFVTIVKSTDRSLIFSDDAEAATAPQIGGSNADVTQYYSARSGSTTNTLMRTNEIAREGLYSYKIGVRDTSVSGWQFNYNELVWAYPPATTLQSYTWQGVSIYLPEYMRGDATPTIFGINALRFNQEQKAHWLEVRNGRWYFVHTLWNANGTYAGEKRNDVGEAEYGKWTDWAVNRNYTNQSTGFIRLYRNKWQVYSYGGINYSASGTRPEPYFHIGIGKPAFDTSSVNNKDSAWAYFDNITFGGPASTIDIISPNQAPTVTIDPVSDTDQDHVTLKATASDIDGTITSYAWVKLSGPDATITGSGSTVTANLTDAGKYTFQVIVTDNKESVGYATVTFQKTEDEVHTPPVVTLPQGITYKGIDQVIVTATVEAETPVTYQWFIDDSPKTAKPVLSGSNTATVTVINHVPGAYTLRVVVTDENGLSDEASYIYTYIPNPSFFFIYSGKIKLLIK